MRKFLFIAILFAIAGFAIFSLIGKTFDTDYANFLPENALITVSLNSPAQLVKKFPEDEFSTQILLE